MFNPSRVLTFPQLFTITGTSAVGTGAVPLSATNAYVAFGFIAGDSGNLEKIRFRISSIVGTAGNVNIVVELRDNNGSSGPAAAVRDSASITGVSATNWHEVTFSGLDRSLVAGTGYWLVFRCTTAPTAYCSIQYALYDGAMSSTPGLTYPPGKINTTDGGSTWTTYVGGISGFIVSVNGTWYGNSLHTAQASSATGQRVYQGYETGCQLITPDAMQLNVVGVGGYARKAAGTFNGYMKLYINEALVATSKMIPGASLSTGATRAQGFFDAPIVVPPNSAVNFTIAVDGGDSAANYLYTFSALYDTTYPETTPLGGKICMARNAAGVWTYTPGTVPDMHLLLHHSKPFLPISVNRRKFNSMR